MKKFLIIIGTLGLVSFFACSAMAEGQASSKFAATWTDTPGLMSVAIITDAVEDTVKVNSNTGYTLATIKIPQDKELLVGISAEIGLVTNTSIKGKNGGTARAIADSEAFVTVYAEPHAGGDSVVAAPGEIILSKRVQDLGATLGGVIQSCDFSCDTTCDITGCSTNCNIDVATDCVVTDEEISLLQNTTAAHHFNFVLPNMDQGVYDIKAVFTTGARAEVDICDEGEECMYDPEGTVSGSAEAIAVINKTMLTVQQVRAAKGGLIDTEITE